MRRRVGIHRCLTCGKEWRYTTVLGGLLKLLIGSWHVVAKHEGDITEISPTEEPLVRRHLI
jgi:hypothetical protein